MVLVIFYAKYIIYKFRGLKFVIMDYNSPLCNNIWILG